MKRLLFALVLACVSGAVAYAVLMRTRSADRQFDCEMSWLSHKLELSPAQAVRVRDLHLKYCPTMNGLNAVCANNRDPARAAELNQASRDSTAKLVEAVSAELKPEQREKYRQLLAASACRMSEEPKAPLK